MKLSSRNPCQRLALLAAPLLLSVVLEAQDDASSAAKSSENRVPSRSVLRVESLAGVAETADVPGLRLQLEGSGVDQELRVGEKAWPIGDLLFLHLPQPSGKTRGERPNVVYRLRGGDLFWARARARPEGVDEDDIVVESPLFRPSELTQASGRLELGITKVKMFTFVESFETRAALRRYESRLWRKVRTDTAESDVLYLKSGDRVVGFVDDLAETNVRFAAEKLGELDLAHAKIRSIVLADEEEDEEEEEGDPEPGPKSSGAPRVQIYLHDGGFLSGSLTRLSRQRVGLRHDALGALDLALDQVAQIGFLGGRCQFLSDLEPSASREHLGPLFRAKLPYRRDANVLGAALRVRGRTYPKGLGVHAFSRLEYELDGAFERFQATIGLDDSARPRASAAGAKASGSVVFRVFADDEKLLEKPMDHADEPHDVNLAIGGKKRLVLEVDFGQGDVRVALDRANWCSARVIKK